WLEELPNLEDIDISEAKFPALPSVPNIRWGLNPNQILSFGSQLDPSKVFAIWIDTDTSQQAIQHTFDLGRNNSLDLSVFGVWTSIRVSPPDNPDELKERWPFFDIIDSQLDEFLETCQGLRRLNLFAFPIRRIPEPIRQLRTLTEISLGGLWLRAVPNWLFEVPTLTSLDLSFNDLSHLPDHLALAKRLKHLNLRGNQFRRIPDAIWKLTALESLDLEGCPIEEIPAEILRLEQLSSLTLGYTKSVAKELVAPPPEIAAQGLEAIKRYWAQERDAGVDYLAEAKLLIVGESGAGKTSLAKKILDS